MSDWLDEALKDFEPPHCNVGARKSGRRMARVLRELVTGVKQARVCFELLREARQIKQTTFDEWFDNMSEDLKEIVFTVSSDDAKEILNEQTK